MATKSDPNKTQTPKQPKGMVDASDDLLLDMENAPPDPDEMVLRFHADGTMEEFPATELLKKAR